MSLPNSTFSDVTRWLQTGTHGSIYTMEMNKCYKSEFCPLKSWLLIIYQRTSDYTLPWLICGIMFMNDLLLTESFVDNCELKEINYRTKNLSVS